MSLRFQILFYRIVIVGIILFMFLYVIATWYYPGGSQENLHSVGFNWQHNYWCNLLDTFAMNGQLNRAKSIATIALVFLSFSLGLFWYVFPYSVSISSAKRKIIQLSGVLSMIVALFLVGRFSHDGIINLASSFGIIATLGTLYGLKILQQKFYFVWGVLNLLGVAVNAMVYYDKSALYLLPVIQKISFVLFLVWVIGICIRLLRVSKTT